METSGFTMKVFQRIDPKIKQPQVSASVYTIALNGKNGHSAGVNFIVNNITTDRPIYLTYRFLIQKIE